MSETISNTLVVIGILFNFLGCLGLLRLPDIYNRLQAATKCVTLGTCMLMLGVVVKIWTDNSCTNNSVGVKALLCIVFILLTSPTGAHAIARAAHLAGISLWKDSVIDKLQEDRNKEEQ